MRQVGPLPLAAWIAIDLVIVMVVLAVVLARSSGDGDTSASLPTANPTSSTRERIGGTTAPPVNSGRPQLLPMGSGFEYVDGTYGVRWAGSVTALVTLDHEPDVQSTTQCVAVIGELTPGSTVGSFSSSSYAPRVRPLVSGELATMEVTSCERSPLEQAGYGWILNAEVTAGTAYPFYSLFEIDADARIEAIVVGSSMDDDTTVWFAPDVTTDRPPRPSLTVGPVVERLEVVGSTHADTYPNSGDSWEVTIDGLVTTSVQPYATSAGRCYLILGTLRPTATEGSLTNPMHTPRTGLSVDGRFVEAGASNCDSSPAADAGYGWILNAEVTVGTEYRFWSEVLVPEGAGEPQAIVGGFVTLVRGVWFEPVVLTSVP